MPFRWPRPNSPRRRIVFKSASRIEFVPNASRDLVPHPTECTKLLVVTSSHRRRIVERPMDDFLGSRQDGARLLGVVAHSHNKIEFLSGDLAHVFAALRSDVDSNFGHHSNGKGMDEPSRRGACRLCLPVPFGKFLPKSLRHLAPG